MTLIFDDDLIPLIRSGKKTVTARLIKTPFTEEMKKPTKSFSPNLFSNLISQCIYKIGEFYDIYGRENGKTEMKAKIKEIDIKHLSEISEEYCLKEGLSNKAEFINIIRRIYTQTVIEEDRLFWTVSFQVFFKPSKKKKIIKDQLKLEKENIFVYSF